MNKQPKISIITPIYNVERYLRECLDSIINQTLSDIEVICIDDCSTDKSLEILKKYAAKDNRFIIIEQKENKGPGVARNSGLKIATGDYIMFVDPDDWLEPNACELAYNKITKNKNDMVFFGLQRYYEETNSFIVDTNKLKPFYELINNYSFSLSQLQTNYFKFAYVWCQIYSREFVINQHLRFSESYHCEDLCFLTKAIVYAGSVSVLDMPIYNYRIRETSQKSKLNKLWKQSLSNRITALEIIQNSGKEIDYIYPYLIYLINSLFYWYDHISQYVPYVSKQYYNMMRSLFVNINNKYQIETIAEYINYRKFKKVCRLSWYKMIISMLLKSIFQVKNTYKHKVFTLLGLKIKIHRKQTTKQKQIITYGSFDILSYVHIEFLKRAKALGNHLIVVLSTEEFNKMKNITLHYTYEQRKAVLEACKYVNLVVPQHNLEQMISDIQRYKADIFVMEDSYRGQFDFLKDYCEIVYLP